MYSQPPPWNTQLILNQIYLGKCLMKLKFKLVVRRLTGVEAIKKKAPNPLPGSSYTSTWTTGCSSAVEVQQQVAFLPSFISPTRQPNKTTCWPLLSEHSHTRGSQQALLHSTSSSFSFLPACRTLQQREWKDFSSPTTFPAQKASVSVHTVTPDP